MNADYINPFLNALQNVLKTMVSIDITPYTPFLKTDSVAYGEVSGIIGLIGKETRGSLSVTFEKNVALEVMHRLLGVKLDEIDPDVADMLGEVTNMVSGGAKRTLSERGIDFDLATPTVVTGVHHIIAHKSKNKTIVIPFECEFGRIHIEVCLDLLPSN